MKVGLIGLPNAGKSTLFNALTSGRVEAAPYPFTTIEQNLGVVEVDHPCLTPVARAVGSAQVVPATIQFVDIAGLVPGASQGEGLGNRFLAHIREADAILHVVRAFNRSDVTHVVGDPDPVRDAELVDTELLLADLETLEKHHEKAARAAKAGDAESLARVAAVESLLICLRRGTPLRAAPLNETESALAGELHLLSRLPVLYILNIGERLAGEEELCRGEFRAFWQRAQDDGAQVVAVCASLEHELATLAPDERESLAAELELGESALARVTEAGRELLELQAYFTGNEKETRLRFLPRGETALYAAGQVHSDMADGFIRAEVIPAGRLIEAGSYAQARQNGWVRIEGRDYVVQDGDVITVRFRAPTKQGRS